MTAPQHLSRAEASSLTNNLGKYSSYYFLSTETPKRRPTKVCFVFQFPDTTVHDFELAIDISKHIRKAYPNLVFESYETLAISYFQIIMRIVRFNKKSPYSIFYK